MTRYQAALLRKGQSNDLACRVNNVCRKGAPLEIRAEASDEALWYDPTHELDYRQRAMRFLSQPTMLATYGKLHRWMQCNRLFSENIHGI
jgi:hypothetical protein